MRFATSVSLLALTVLVGCVRFGYDPVTRSAGPSGGTSGDSGTPHGDGSVGDAGSSDGSVRPDAGKPDAADGDAAIGSDSGDPSSDAAAPGDGGSSDDGSIGATDSGATDSGATDSGAADSGAADSGVSEYDNPKRTAQCNGIPGAVFCDGFEASDFSLWSYPFAKNGTVSRSTTVVRTGSGALHAHTNANPSGIETGARMSVRAVDHLTSGDLYARYYYRISSATNLNDYISTAVLSEYENPYYGFSVLISSSEMGLASGQNTHFVSGVFPPDQWLCVEMHVLIADQPQGSWEFYRAGTRIYSEFNDTLPTNGMTLFEVGIHFAPTGQGAADAYVDDVVVGTQRIGCTAELSPP